MLSVRCIVSVWVLREANFLINVQASENGDTTTELDPNRNLIQTTELGGGSYMVSAQNQQFSPGPQASDPDPPLITTNCHKKEKGVERKT